MKIIKIILLLLSLLLLLSACKKEEEELPDDIEPPLEDEIPVVLEVFEFTPETFPRMDGSPSTMPLAEALASIMLGQSRQSVSGLAVFDRTTQAFRNLADDLCDILIVGEPSPDVLNDISAQDFRYDMAPIAMDALVFIVSSGNPVNNLSSEQIKSIYTGEITDWQKVGGSDIDIIAFQRNEEAMSQVLMEKLVMDWQKMADAPVQYFSPAHFGFWQGSADDLITAIKGFDGSANAIGFTMYHYAVNMGMADGYKVLSIDGVMPSTDTIASGEYPFINPYYAVINNDLPEDDPARILYNWLQTNEGKTFIGSQGYVPSDELSIEMGWTVKTDVSQLTPYSSPRSNFTRLNDTAMPELVPSDSYGQILPYATSVTMNDGRIFTSKYGFVAQRSGTVISDPIYDKISRAMFVSSNGAEYLPAYHLHMDLPFDDSSFFGFQTIQAACAMDGSWITPFSYVNIVFREEVMLMVYDHFSFNIDVYDYNGNLLYNILDLDWPDKIPGNNWSGDFLYSVNEGIGFITIDNESFFAIDMLTGDLRETDIFWAQSFSNGLAAVKMHDIQSLWGFVDKDFNLVIEPSFVWEAAFMNNRAIVETPDGMRHIIDKQGTKLYSVSSDYLIVQNYDGYGITVYGGSEFPRLLTNDFVEIAYPPGALPYNPESSISYLGKGWYSCSTENGVWIFNQNDVFALPSKLPVVDFTDGLIIYREYGYYNYHNYNLGIMKPDGLIILEPEGASNITALSLNGEVFGFAVNTTRPDPDNYSFVSEIITRVEYRLIDRDGQLIKADLGMLSYDEVSGLLYVQGTDYFAYMNRQGETLISIPSMAYTFD